MAQFLQRRSDAAKGAAFDVERDDLLFYQKAPAIAEWMCQNCWEDGTARETATFLIFFEDNAFKCWIHDRAAKRSAFVTGRSMQDLFEMVETGLKHDLLVWRRDRTVGKK